MVLRRKQRPQQSEGDAVGVSRWLHCYAGTRVRLNELFPLLSPHTRLLAPCFGYTKLFLVLPDFVFHEGDRQESNDHGSKLKSRLRKGQRESGL